jgi:hypothetical protein
LFLEQWVNSLVLNLKKQGPSKIVLEPVSNRFCENSLEFPDKNTKTVIQNLTYKPIIYSLHQTIDV